MADGVGSFVIGYVSRMAEETQHPDPGPRVAVLIPALDEEEALPGVLEALPSEIVQRVVVVDNGSTDGTARVAREAGATVIREPRRGYGAACLAGLAHLSDLPTPPRVVVFMDADQSDEPQALPRLLEPILKDEADLVLGVRRASEGGASRAVPPHARLGNAVVLALVRLLFGHRFSDLPPFRAVVLSRLRELEMDDLDWGWTLQMQLRARARGLEIREVPVPHRPRAAGESKISGTLVGSLRAGVKMLYTLVRERLRTLP